ncbi:MAG: ribose-phosphate pyrophosphokinase [Nitrospirota bacterium]|nr:ribose-phosphate pyrophosphokinase [Nitrospirota bacterium]MDH5295805.1 ribose-phosphate pyrophosphokinase [Nitrospirota bacterium]MDH5574497.1 ribose-phosphate pyrophosphokinase [Nitrospirota bacterium]
MLRDLKLLTGNSNLALAREIAQYIGQDLGQATVTTFSDGEIRVRIEENVRGGDVFLIQSCCHPVNTSIMELLLLIDAVKRSSASRITAVIPYYGYGRQDRKDQPRVPISAKLIADLITVAGANRILTMDLHAGPIQGFFNIPVDHLYAMPVLLDYIKKQNVSDLVIVSPDAGGVERARAFAKRLNSSLAIIDKRRESPNQAEVMNIIGDVRNKHALLFDDMIDTAGTIVQTAQTCMDNGALSAWAGSTHAVLSGPALERLQGSCLREVVVTNTIPLNGKEQQCSKLKALTVAPLLGEAILRIHREESVTSLFV